MELPIIWIHLVRNPYDSITTFAFRNFEKKIKNNEKTNIIKELNKSIQNYNELNIVIEKLKRSENVLTINHEFVITRMHDTLEKIANFLNISFNPIWRDNVRNNVWKKPRITRRITAKAIKASAEKNTPLFIILTSYYDQTFIFKVIGLPW